MALVVGNVVGMGIFLTASEVAAVSTTPGMYLAFWIVGGIVAWAGTQAFAELATRFPFAGGDYVYLERAYGAPLAFSWGWLSFIGAFCGSIATLAAGAAETLAASSFGSFLAERSLTLGPVTITGVQLASVAIIFGITWLNARGLSISARVQQGLTWVPVFAFSAMALVLLAMDTGAAAAAPPQPVDTGWAGWGAAFSAVFFTYSGWNAIVYMAGEVKEPAKNLPWSMAVGVVIVVALYFLINMAFLETLTLEEVAGARNVGVALGERLVGGTGADIIAVFIFLAIISSLNSTTLGGSRVWKVMADQGHFWRRARYVSPLTGQPVVSLAIQAGVSIALVFAGDFGELLTFTGAAMMLLSVFSVGAVFVFRRRMGEPTQYKAIGYPWVPLVYVGAMVGAMFVGLLFDSGPYIAGAGALLALIIGHRWLRRPQ